MGAGPNPLRRPGVGRPHRGSRDSGGGRRGHGDGGGKRAARPVRQRRVERRARGRGRGRRCVRPRRGPCRYDGRSFAHRRTARPPRLPARQRRGHPRPCVGARHAAGDGAAALREPGEMGDAAREAEGQRRAGLRPRPSLQDDDGAGGGRASTPDGGGRRACAGASVWHGWCTAGRRPRCGSRLHRAVAAARRCAAASDARASGHRRHHRAIQCALRRHEDRREGCGGWARQQRQAGIPDEGQLYRVV